MVLHTPTLVQAHRCRTAMMLLTLLAMASDREGKSVAAFLAFVCVSYVSHMKRGRGRPSLKPSARAPKALALSADVVITQEFDDRGRPRAPLVEVARRTEVSCRMRLSKLRVILIVRRAYCSS